MTQTTPVAEYLANRVHSDDYAKAFKWESGLHAIYKALGGRAGRSISRSGRVRVIEPGSIWRFCIEGSSDAETAVSSLSAPVQTAVRAVLAECARSQWTTAKEEARNRLSRIARFKTSDGTMVEASILYDRAMTDGRMNLSGMGMVGLPLLGLPAASIIDLSDNQLSGIRPDAIHASTTSLLLRNNQISQLDAGGWPATLRTLDVRGNMIPATVVSAMRQSTGCKILGRGLSTGA